MHIRASELDEIEAMHPIVALVREYRRLALIRGASITPLVELVRNAPPHITRAGRIAISGCYDTATATGLFIYHFMVAARVVKFPGIYSPGNISKLGINGSKWK